MFFTIAGAELSGEKIIFLETSLGNDVVGQTVTYEISAPAQDFCQRFAPIYESCVNELARDDEITGKSDPPYVGAVVYPSFEDFLNLPDSQRMEMVDTFFVSDILRLYVYEGAASAGLQWLVISLNLLFKQNENVVIRGLAVALNDGKPI